MYTGKEHWLGLDNIFKLTNRKNVKTQLKIILESYSGIVVSFPHTRAGRKAIVTYDDFHLKDQVVYIHTYITLLFYKIKKWGHSNFAFHHS